MERKKWLDAPPAAEEIMQDDKGYFYIPIEIVRRKLDYLNPYWSIKNFFHTYVSDHNGCVMCSGSIELVLPKTELDEYDRTLTGAATISVEEFKQRDNQHYAATVLSLCISNAAKILGETFGRSINDEKSENKGMAIKNTLNDYLAR